MIIHCMSFCTNDKARRCSMFGRCVAGTFCPKDGRYSPWKGRCCFQLTRTVFKLIWYATGDHQDMVTVLNKTNKTSNQPWKPWNVSVAVIHNVVETAVTGGRERCIQDNNHVHRIFFNTTQGLSKTRRYIGCLGEWLQPEAASSLRSRSTARRFELAGKPHHYHILQHNQN